MSCTNCNCSGCTTWKGEPIDTHLAIRDAALEEAAQRVEPSSNFEMPDLSIYTNYDDAAGDWADWREQETLKALAVSIRALKSDGGKNK